MEHSTKNDTLHKFYRTVKLHFSRRSFPRLHFHRWTKTKFELRCVRKEGTARVEVRWIISYKQPRRARGSASTERKSSLRDAKAGNTENPTPNLSHSVSKNNPTFLYGKRGISNTAAKQSIQRPAFTFPMQKPCGLGVLSLFELNGSTTCCVALLW